MLSVLDLFLSYQASCLVASSEGEGVARVTHVRKWAIARAVRWARYCGAVLSSVLAAGGGNYVNQGGRVTII